MTRWFTELKNVNPAYYPDQATDVVGYYRGDPSQANRSQWMVRDRAGRAQMVVLGSDMPTAEQWVAAGVAQRGHTVTLRLGDLTPGLRIIYAGFMLRPWGYIVVEDVDVLAHWPAQLAHWRANYKPPRG